MSCQQRADEVKAVAAGHLRRIARERLMEFGRWWHSKFPRCTVEILWGNGTCYIEVGGRHAFRWERNHDQYLSLKPLYAAVDDAEAICDPLTVPDDFIVKGGPNVS